MPDDFDLDAALDHLDASTRTLVRVRPAEEIRTRGARRHRARVGALSAAAAVVAVAVVAGYLSTGSGPHRSAPPAVTTTATPTHATLRTVSDELLLTPDNLPWLQGGSWTGGTTRDEAAISDPAHSCEHSTLTALGALEARQRDWTYVTPAGSGTRYRQVVGSYASDAEAVSAAGALATVFARCTPTGLTHAHVGRAVSGLTAQDARGLPVATADVYEISGTVSGTEGRFEYVAVGRRGNAVVLMVLSQNGGQDSNLDQSVYTQPVTVALNQLAPYDPPAATG